MKTKVKVKDKKAPRIPFDRARETLLSTMCDKVRELRTEQQMTLATLAEKVGISVGYLSHLERGRYEPSISVVYKLALALGVTVNDLIVEPEGRVRL